MSKLAATASSVETRVRAILARCFAKDEDAVRAEVVIDDLGADSLDMVEAKFAIEREFAVNVPDDLFPGHGQRSMVTVGQVCDAVAKLAAAEGV